MKLLYVYLLYPKRKQAGEQLPHSQTIGNATCMCLWIAESLCVFSLPLWTMQRARPCRYIGAYGLDRSRPNWLIRSHCWSWYTWSPSPASRRRGLKTTIHDINLYVYMYLFIYHYRNYRICNFLYCFVGLNLCVHCQMLIYTVDWTGASSKERKCWSFETAAKKDSNPIERPALPG